MGSIGTGKDNFREGIVFPKTLRRKLAGTFVIADRFLNSCVTETSLRIAMCNKWI